MLNCDPIRELALPGFHSIVLRCLDEFLGSRFQGKILDAGAGHGAFTQKLHKRGYETAACDLHPELFQVEGVECRPADLTTQLPWDAESFDGVIALEVVEHLDGVFPFFREVHRVLKPGGFFLFTTPNILSLKSRFRFLLSGYFYAFPPLSEDARNAITQHINPLSYEFYDFRLRSSGFSVQEVMIDKYQRWSLCSLFLYPFIQIYSRLLMKATESSRRQNQLRLLLGRTMIVIAVKNRN